MAISFRGVSLASLVNFTADVPGGAIVGLIGEESPALSDILRLACGVVTPELGVVEASEPRRYIGPGEPLNLALAGTLALDRTLSLHDALVRVRSRMGLERLRRSGSSILIYSHEQDFLRDLCDEVWWLHAGALAGRGEPREVLAAYNTHLARRLNEWASSLSQTLEPSMRRGDGRARLLSLETLDSAGKPSLLWRSGEPAFVRVRVRFEQPVEDPVVGIMIRTRIGFEVFGTNTELEGVKLGPVPAGATLQVIFALRCDLCPQEYTLTAASHDPDGVWHDWVEDALAFTVADTRYTAGVANLRASVRVAREG
jgi:lipopolysaccharide transport system ATP-binding protein